ncbi:MAG: sodium-dependent transporter [Bacteroidales bacterium]|nr:sodium-dependent transporter [Bacteroidales bacterium]
MKKERENFGSRAAVIMAMAGSAIGLGNIWRFPYMVGEYGGAAFIVVYIFASLLLALPIFFAESIIGRRSGANTFGAMETLAPRTRWKWLGLLTIVSPVIILSYYSVVGGWSVEYLFKALAFDFAAASDAEVTGFFGRFIASTWQPVVAHTVFLATVAGIVLAGVKKGIEKFTKATMPVLFVLIVLIAAYSLTLPGSRGGVDYLLRPDFSKLTPSVVAAAMGQAFFSLSLGVGTILTYASYMRKDENLLASGLGTAASDLFFAVLAGFAVVPAVFAAGLAPGAGPGLVFETLPYIFHKMGATLPWASAIIAIVFFLTILVAALTSAISMLEVGVAYLTEEKGMDRRAATWALTAFAWVVGVLCSLSFGPLSHVHLLGNPLFDFLDKLCSNWLLPLGGLLFTLFVGWKMPRADVYDEFTNGGTLRANLLLFPLVHFLIRYAAPVGIFVVFLTDLLL